MYKRGDVINSIPNVATDNLYMKNSRNGDQNFRLGEKYS